MKNSSLARRKGLNPGTKGLSQGCGRVRYADELAARLALAGPGCQDSATRHENSGERVARHHEACGGWHLYPVSAGLARKPAERAPRAAGAPRRPARDTGFPAAVKAACRKRSEGRCEGCGIWLGEGGQIQHRVARGSGGTSSPVISSIVNALHLCGTPQSGCHGLAESRDGHAHEAGLWLKSTQDPAAEPVMLHSAHGSGVTVWLTGDGGYSTEPPEGLAA